jgi:hypothetical protein
MGKSRHSTIHSITSSARVSSVGGMVRPSANSAWLVFDWVGGDGSTMSALPQRSAVRELDLQPLGGETGQKWAGINDLLRHPGARLGNITLD